MNAKKKTLIGASLMLVGAILIAVKYDSFDDTKESPTPLAAPSNTYSKPRPGDSSNSTLADLPGKSSEEVSTPQPLLSPEKMEEARNLTIEKLQDASTTYDPAALPIIRPYLESQDPEIREAAINAMINLDDASAGPMLREAAAKIDSVEDAAKMLEAAEYIELPPADLKALSEMLKARKQQAIEEAKQKALEKAEEQ